ncbi:hypothetical protein FNF31_07760 [Cafeteria roenbergensis]|uniref:EF-hand domain-containing protein n=1 Tax=Cafeteria roenbergensis TaxID=33653 RepID=A0A5A8C160_CAFRO|nr:hypothetical protein FNF31_07760 [Cafeteria roenbergensis]
MGGTLCGGSVSSFHGEFILEFNRFATLLTRMGLTQLEARKLYEAYRALDTDNSGVISAEEFRVRTCAPDTPFAAKVYAIFDYRKIGEVDFGEFVAVVWNFCTYTPYTLVSLIFDMYDDDGSGSLDFAEVQKLVRELYGIQSGIGEPRLLAALESLSGGGIFDRSRPIHRDQFETFAIEHPAVVRPALDMQADVRPDAPSPGATKRQSAP